MKLLEKTIISQYANSPVICSLLSNINECLDPNSDIERFYNLIWNLDTAKGVGLDFWGKVVGINRNIQVEEKNQFIGSNLAAEDLKDFTVGTKHLMNDEMYRTIIFLKAMSNIIYATAPHINKLVSSLFEKRGKAYFIKNGTMMARYVFDFNLTPVEKAVIISTDLLPRPTGVLVDFYEPDIKNTFGFNETGMAPFGQGTFYIGDR
ncbi:hypothetical protein HS327_01321 [Glaesserella parasuis]|uniref:DUF2612 domain-containing protein n=1 Tax=Glaesserella parasuis TaxID=738 RepID=UPI0004DD6695|nr:DUF2612 domain-containing protein [Glaesserella parasuis]KEZ22293.1 hypothetical protein HS327_01321 [Glaesserella parasuis]